MHTLVVGGTRGIGRAVTERFAADGGTVSVVARQAGEDLENVRHWEADLADAGSLPERVAEIVQSGGPLRNLALLQRFRGGGDDWDGELAVSLTATKAILESAQESFEEQGSVVIVGSHAARLVADEQPVAYHAAKAALLQMVRYYAVELGPRGIRVNCVTPGAVVKEGGRGAEDAELLGDVTPLRRVATADDVAAAVALLCSDDAAMVTGQELAVDGGMSLLLQESLVRRLRR